MLKNKNKPLWQNYDICTTKEKIIESAKRDHGGFVCTDGAWCMTRTTKEFADMLGVKHDNKRKKALKIMQNLKFLLLHNVKLRIKIQ